MRLRHIEVFQEVARELHFGRAAKRLHVAPPAVSQTIAALEQELGVSLFDRSRRQIQLTPAGETFLEESRRLLKQLEQAVEATLSTASGRQGRLRVGFTSVCALGALPLAVVAYREAFPQVQLSLHQMGTTQQCQALQEGSLDLGLSVHAPQTTSLAVEPITGEPLVAFVPAGHRLARRKEVPLALLLQEAIILMTHQHEPTIYEAYHRLCRDVGLPPNIFCEVDHLEPALAFIAAGLGFTLAPSIATKLRLKGVVHRPVHPALPGRVSALWNPANERPTIEPFLELLRERATHDANASARKLSHQSLRSQTRR